MPKKHPLHTLILLIIPLLILSACGGNSKVNLTPDQPKAGSAEFFYNEGIRSFNSGDLAQAQQQFSAALAKAPNHANATLGMGIVHLSRQEFPQSLTYFERLKKLTPNSLDVYNYLGIVHMEMGNNDLAREHFLIAATSEKYETPENAYANLASLELKQNNIDGAMRYIGKGMEKKRSFPLLHALEGKAYEARKQWAEALASYEKASALSFHKDIGLIIQMSRMYRQTGETLKALDLLEKSLGKAATQAERQAILDLISEINR